MQIEISLKEYEIVRRGLLELPAKDSMVLIATLDSQVVEQSRKEEKKEWTGSQE